MPYSYSFKQQNEIKKLVKEMLQTGVIQPSQSTFVSPILLVKKKDGSWSFCTDYRKLNVMTIKNKFPIPIMDDLLNELEGSQYFSKLDLRSRYHQVRMKPDDTYKTTFRTHQGGLL